MPSMHVRQHITASFHATCLAPPCVHLLLLLLPLSCTSLPAGRRGLLQDRIGIKSTRSFEAPQATRWSVGSHTSASGPAVFRTTADFTGPQPPSFAVGVNPSAGYADVQTKTHMDASQPIPQHSMRAGAYAGNNFVADVSLGGRITPIATGQIKIRPTAPVTLPTFNFGGSVLPTYREQMVINPRAPRPAEATAPKR